MRLGFTGTQRGMTVEQQTTIWKLLSELQIDEIHHGDCIGSDAKMDAIAKAFRIKTIAYPPINSYKRAYCDADEIKDPEEYLKRNHNIVDATEVLLATPLTADEVLRSGTWSTIRYAMKTHKPVYLIQPGGKLNETVQL